MILIDDRQGSGEFAPLISLPHITCRLEFADFAWSGNGENGSLNIGVERKTLLDLLSSVTTGRLSGHQLIGLTNDYDYVYLLIEGVWKPDKDSGILMKVNKHGKWEPVSQGSRRFMARDIYNYFSTLQIMCGVIVVCVGNKWETVRWLEATYSWWQKKWKDHKSHLQFQRPVEHAQLVKPSLVTKIASQFDGCGMDKARKLGGRFKTLEEFFFATREELMEIEGIGKKLAESIISQRGI